MVGGGVIDEEPFVSRPLPSANMLKHALINKGAIGGSLLSAFAVSRFFCSAGGVGYL